MICKNIALLREYLVMKLSLHIQLINIHEEIVAIIAMHALIMKYDQNSYSPIAFYMVF